MKDRFHYIDIAKGILILLVVIHHQPQLAAEFGISNPFLAALACSSDYFNAFFMPAFFVITGYCTNFQKLPFGKFLGRQAMTIMLPAFCLGAVSVWISLFGKGCTNPIEYCKIGFRTFAISGGHFGSFLHCSSPKCFTVHGCRCCADFMSPTRKPMYGLQPLTCW